jgi:hypothetical protein
VLRTEELLAAHRFDGAEQYFTRAVDFGYSFSDRGDAGEVGRGGDPRRLRPHDPHHPPDVIVGFVFDGEGGGQHHQASSQAHPGGVPRGGGSVASPSRSRRGPAPVAGEEVLLHGGVPLQASQDRRARRRASRGEGASAPLMFRGGDVYDPVLGRTCNEIGRRGAQHAHVPGHVAAPAAAAGPDAGPGGVRAYRLRDTVLPDGVNRQETEMFDGVDTS